MNNNAGEVQKIEPDQGRVHIGVLLRTGWHGFLDELFERLADEGFDDLTPSHSPVFQHIERGGTRIGVLAERAHMTNQSMGYLVDALEARGYFERKPDPDDRRASLVVITDRGREQIRVARRLIADIEREWEERIGAERMALLREALEALASSLSNDLGRRPPRRAAERV